MSILPPSPFIEPSMANGGACETPAAAANPDAAGDFDGPDIPLAELVKRGFDAEGFVNDCERLPAFLSAPSQQYLTATEIIPVLQTLAGH